MPSVKAVRTAFKQKCTTFLEIATINDRNNKSNGREITKIL